MNELALRVVGILFAVFGMFAIIMEWNIALANLCLLIVVGILVHTFHVERATAPTHAFRRWRPLDAVAGWGRRTWARRRRRRKHVNEGGNMSMIVSKVTVDGYEFHDSRWKIVIPNSVLDEFGLLEIMHLWDEKSVSHFKADGIPDYQKWVIDPSEDDTASSRGYYE